jgi:hypothetical protein
MAFGKASKGAAAGAYEAPAKGPAEDEGGSARETACKQLASLLGVPEAKYGRFMRLLKLATGAAEED